MKLFTPVLLFISFMSFGQGAVVENFRDVAGTPFFPKQYRDVNGTPYLFEDWTLATIELTNGRKLENIKTNFNLVTDELIYIDEKGKTMVANTALIKMVSAPSANRKFITTPARNTFYEVVSSEGKAVLLRYNKKVIQELKPYNSATIQRNFVTNESLMLSIDDKLVDVKSLKDLYKVLTPAASLKAFAKKEKLRNKSEESMAKLVAYYNSLQGS